MRLKMSMSQAWSDKNRWILYESVVYLTGKGIQIGDGYGPIFNPQSHSDGVYSVYITDVKHKGHQSFVGRGTLDVLTDNSFDWICLWNQDDTSILRKALKKLKYEANVILINCKYAEDDFKIKGFGFIEKLDRQTETDRLQIYKINRGGKKGLLGPKGGDPVSKRACVVRFGAIGDLIMITPALRKFKENGYHVTVLTHTATAPVLVNNPNVDNLLVQERDAIPNGELAAYEKYWQQKYDRYVVLSESIEGGLLKVENRRDFYLPKDQRYSRENYWDRTLELCGFAGDKVVGELYFTDKETKRAKEFVEDRNRFYLMCPLKGSSWHKIYPMLQPTLRQWLQDKPDVVVFLTGDSAAKRYEFEFDNVISLVDKIDLRTALALTKEVDLVFGPETGIMNAAGCYDTPKIMVMSHSAPHSLAKYWENVECLEPNVPCYPCYQLHYSLESCPIKENLDKNGKILYKGPACTVHGKDNGAIPANKVMEAMDKVYNAWQHRTN